jgi:hypothetical protein
LSGSTNQFLYLSDCIQGVIAERPIFCNNSSRNEVNIDDTAIV